MKKVQSKILLVFSLALAISSLFTFSSVTFATPATPDISKETATQASCGGCSEGKTVPDGSPAKTVKKISEANKEIIDLAKKSLQSAASQSHYKVGEFNWDETQVTEYNETNMKGVLIPAKKQTDLERIFLQFTYDSEQGELGKPVVMKLNREDPNDDKHFSMTYNTLKDQAIVGLELDYEKQEAKKVEYMDESEIKAAGYWDCVQNCLKKVWNKMPIAWKIVCEGACGGCIWGGNPVVCGACLSCLAGYGIGCGTACA